MLSKLKVLKIGGQSIMDRGAKALLPLYLRMGCIPILGGMPPFGFWEKPGRRSTIPEHRTDAGPFLLAEFFGCPEVLYVKDEDGLFEDDPKKSPDAARIPEITAQELLDRDLPHLVIERAVVEHLVYARRCRSVRVIDGLRPGELLRALAGEPVGSVIRGG